MQSNLKLVPSQESTTGLGLTSLQNKIGSLSDGDHRFWEKEITTLIDAIEKEDLAELKRLAQITTHCFPLREELIRFLRIDHEINVDPDARPSDVKCILDSVRDEIIEPTNGDAVLYSFGPINDTWEHGNIDFRDEGHCVV